MFGLTKSSLFEAADQDLGSAPVRRASAWLQDRLAKGRKARFYEDVHITPQMAQALLTLNTGNRTINQAKVRRYTNILLRGRFILIPGGISVSRCGILNDGQHRLLAVIASGVSAHIHMTWGAERKEFKVTDAAGSARSVADILSIEGKKSSVVLASLSLSLWRLENKELRDTPDPQDIAGLGMELDLEGEEACRVGQNMAKVTTPTSAALAALAIIQRPSSPERAAEIEAFWRFMQHGGADLRLGKVRDALQRRTGKFAKISGHNGNIVRAAALILAWNAGRGRKDIDYGWTTVHVLPEVTR